MAELILSTSLLAAVPFVLGLLVESGRPRARTEADLGPGRRVNSQRPRIARVPRTLRGREVPSRRVGRVRVLNRSAPGLP